MKRLPNGSRGEETVTNKTKTQGKSFFISIFVKKWNLGRILLIFIHSLINQPINSKSNELSHSLGRLFSHQSQNLILKYDWITAREYCPFCYNPSKGHEWGIGRGCGWGEEGVSKEICGTVRLPV